MAETTQNPAGPRLADGYGRLLSYLRISVSDRCNLQCVYCMPHGFSPTGRVEEFLTHDEIVAVVTVLAERGLRKVRLTGGEPLLHRGIVSLVERVARVPGIEIVTMTTNGINLPGQARALRDAGLSTINVSLDTLRPDRFEQITGKPFLPKVLEGVDESLAAGFDAVKLNMVVMRGVNEDEILDFADLARDRALHVRYIEFMPIGANDWEGRKVFPNEEVRRIVGDARALVPAERERHAGPATLFTIPGYAGRVGFISAISHGFCDSCNRMRLTANGRLRACLLTDQETDLLPILRNGRNPEEILARVREAIASKPEHHAFYGGDRFPDGAEGGANGKRQMYQIGG